MTFKITPKTKPAVNPAALAAFAAGADGHTTEPAGQGGAASSAQAAVTPPPTDWEALDDKRLIPAFSLRLTEREGAQLKHIAATTPDSAHEFCKKAIKKALAEHFGK